MITGYLIIIINSFTGQEDPCFVTHASPFLLVPRQLLPAPDLKLISTTSIHLVLGCPLGLLRVMPPISTCFVILCPGSLRTCPNQRSLCVFITVVIEGSPYSASVRCWFSSPTDLLPSFRRISSRVLSFPKSLAFLSLFDSFTGYLISWEIEWVVN